MFGYDALNRLNLAETTSTYATSPSDCWGEIFQYDNTSTGGGWGNLTNIAGASSAYTGCTQENLNMTATSKNQLQDLNNDYVYDAAGNLNTIPSIASYSYDAENHLVTTAGLNYLYDGDGRRVAKKSGSTVTKIYWYGQNGEVLDETDGTGSVSNSVFNEYIFFGGQRVARRDSSSNVNYYFADHLGTARIVANSSGTILDDSDFYPFGGERVVISSSGNTYKFTGKERDSESGLDNFTARYFGSSLGRFMSPDPLAGHTEDPQTLNRYAYVRNNPLNLTDPTGLDFYLSCQKASNTCQKDAAGNLVQGQYVTDANGAKSFQATVVTSASLRDSNSGNTGTVNENGVQITTNGKTSQGIFINGTDAANLQGSGKLSDFVFNINGSNEKKGTLDSGSFTYTGSRDQADVVRVLNERGAFTYAAERTFGNKFHPGELNFRFTSGSYPNLFDYGPSPHLLVPQDPRATVPVGPGYAGSFHIDSHTGSVRHGACALEGIGCQ